MSKALVATEQGGAVINTVMRFAGFDGDHLSVGSAGAHLRHAQAAGVLATTANIVTGDPEALSAHDEEVLDAVMDDMLLEGHDRAYREARRSKPLTVELGSYAGDLLVAHEHRRQPDLVGAASS